MNKNSNWKQKITLSPIFGLIFILYFVNGCSFSSVHHQKESETIKDSARNGQPTNAAVPRIEPPQKTVFQPKEQINISIIPFQWSGKASIKDDISAIVNQDLKFSGEFLPLSESNLPNRPLNQAQIDYPAWKRVKQKYVVIGHCAFNPTIVSYNAAWEIFDVESEKSLAVGSASAGSLRDISHYASDQIYEKIIGKKGVFSTKLMYVTTEASAGKAKRYRLNYSDVDGYRETVLLVSRQPLLSPSWSPDARKIAYVSFQDKQPAIFIQELKTAKQFKITDFNGINGAPAWSPDGSQLAMSLSKDGSPEIYVMDVSTRELRRITANHRLNTEPSWTPDGKKLIFTSDKLGLETAQIYQVNLLTGEETQLTFEGSFNAKATITKDGRYMVYVHRTAQGKDTVAVQDMQNNTINVLTNTDLDESPSVAPNGSMVIYATNSQGSGLLRVVTLNGGFTFNLPAKSADVREPAWSPFLN